jgi:hypothetical protein
MAVLRVGANTPTPSIVVETQSAPRCEQVEAIGIELSGLPLGTVDIYRRCDERVLQRYVTQCSLRKDGKPNIVARCGTDTSACELVLPGRFELVAHSEYLDNSNCRSASGQREPLATDSQACGICDAFEDSVVTAAINGETPDQNQCCRKEAAAPTLQFCLKPCSCRRTVFSFRHKKDEDFNRSANLSLAVISNVEGNRSVFERFAESTREQGVELVLNLGELSTGGQAEVRKMASFARSSLQSYDGTECPVSDDAICCDDQHARDFPEFCNAMLASPQLSSSLGANETDAESFYTFFENFGPSTYSAFIGRVQLIMLDSADATLGTEQLAWLKQQLAKAQSRNRSCTMVNALPEGLEDWPLLWECASNDCNLCLGMAAQCVAPPASRSDSSRGPLNCLCVPAAAKTCPGNLHCVDQGDGSSSCRCTRDEDCGQGGRCDANGLCQDPLRLFFTYTPPFDLLGARNAAFLSRREAAALVATLLRGGVDLIFAGSIKTFAELRIAGIPLFITGGGGADMEIFDETGHHYLLLNIPSAYEEPDVSRVSIRRISLQ